MTVPPTPFTPADPAPADPAPADPPADPAVSVVLCVLNGTPWIGRQLDALAAQRADRPWELVVVDNGSTDGTQDLVRARAGGFPVPLRLVDAADRAGLPHARNVGALAARGATLAFCDCDDVVSPGWVAAAARATAHAALAGGVNRVLGEPLDPDAEILNPGGVIRGSFGNAVLGCNFAVRRADYLAIGGFDESLPPYGCDDVEFSLRMNEAGRTVVGAPDMQIHFRRTTGTRSLLRKTYLSGLAETVVWARHRDRYGDQLHGRRRVVSLLRWPTDTVAVAVRERAVPGRSAARDLTTRVARVVGWWNITRRGSLPAPGLLEHD